MDLLIAIIRTVLIVSVVLSLVPLLIWWERKGAAYIQDRRGPNRANILGIRLGGFIHNFADAIKLFFKEDIIPAKANKLLFVAAPIIMITSVVSLLAVIPFASPLQIGPAVIKFQIADLNVGVIYLLAAGSFSVYAVMLAGWSSNGAYSLFGGLRAAAQFISYEAAAALSLLGVVIFSGSIRLDEIIALQGVNVIDWNVVRQPLAFILFLVCLFAESNRNPFDLPEGESELVAGYHTEYSSMKFALFFMGEYAHIAIGSMILVTLFFGGWQVPFFSTEALNDIWTYSAITVIVQFACFMAKVLFWCWFFVWVRWTLPRFRYDQLMRLGWAVIVPLALMNIILTACFIYYRS